VYTNIYINIVVKNAKRVPARTYPKDWPQPRKHCFVPVFFTALLALAAPRRGFLDIDLALALASRRTTRIQHPMALKDMTGIQIGGTYVYIYSIYTYKYKQNSGI
jgi:hypothetical protein